MRRIDLVNNDMLLNDTQLERMAQYIRALAQILLS